MGRSPARLAACWELAPRCASSCRFTTPLFDGWFSVCGVLLFCRRTSRARCGFRRGRSPISSGRGRRCRNWLFAQCAVKLAAARLLEVTCNSGRLDAHHGAHCMDGVMRSNKSVNADAQNRFAASPRRSSAAGYVRRLGLTECPARSAAHQRTPLSTWSKRLTSGPSSDVRLSMRPCIAIHVVT